MTRRKKLIIFLLSLAALLAVVNIIKDIRHNSRSCARDIQSLRDSVHILNSSINKVIDEYISLKMEYVRLYEKHRTDSVIFKSIIDSLHIQLRVSNLAKIVDRFNKTRAKIYLGNIQLNIPNADTRVAIEVFAPLAIDEYALGKTAQLPSVKLAQLILESASLTSKLYRKTNNMFGIKCHNRNCPPGHCIKWADDTPNDKFRKYPTRWLSFRHHTQVIEKYNLSPNSSYKQQCIALQKRGYATDRSYAQKLISIIEKYRLHQIDEIAKTKLANK